MQLDTILCHAKLFIFEAVFSRLFGPSLKLVVGQARPSLRLWPLAYLGKDQPALFYLFFSFRHLACPGWQ